MDKFLNVVQKVSDWIWGLPLIITLTAVGLYMTVLLKFFQFRYPLYIMKQTFGSVFKKPKGEGTVTPLQALTSALSSTIGAANIVGVPAAIMFGGPGAVFWMWVIAIFGMALKFSESVLAVHYREKNREGEYVGGPMYYITKGLKMKWLGIFFAFALMIEVIPSLMVQGNSLAGSVAQTFSVSPLITGIITSVIIGLIVIGGIKRVGKTTELFVPFMALLYVGAALLVVIIHIDQFPNVLSLIFSSAFQPVAAVGGFVGAALSDIIRWGFARGLYSNEAGFGTAPIAHAAAKTDHPVRQGFWAIVGIFVDTIVVCTATAFVILSTGVWTKMGASKDTDALATVAFTETFGTVGSYIVTISLCFFVLSTALVLVFYGVKQAEFLFGVKMGHVMKVIYLGAIIVGSVGGAKVIWSFLDIALASILLPNLLAIVLLSKKVKELKEEFFTSEQYYLLDIKKDKNVNSSL
ncbi:sodium:alanine symporter family protein [Priestia filamentosa]|nr:sodium:alanine symporter family protein [Priestia filamentosa]